MATVLFLYLPGITLKPGESIEKTYTVTENMSGHVDYSCPTVAVTVNATIRYASKGNPMWYGTAVSDKSDSSVQYTLGLISRLVFFGRMRKALIQFAAVMKPFL